MRSWKAKSDALAALDATAAELVELGIRRDEVYSRHRECILAADKLGIERSTIINRSALSRRTVYLILGEAGQ